MAEITPSVVAQNPSVKATGTSKERKDKSKRIPMSIPQLNLQVPAIPGWHLHWALESNLPRYLQGGYEFCNDGDVPVNQKGVGTSKDIDGNADMGSRIRVIAGTLPTGEPEYFVLMKIEEEYYREDQKKIEDHNTRILKAIFRRKQVMDGSQSISQEDKAQRYVKQADINKIPLFQRRLPKEA